MNRSPLDVLSVVGVLGAVFVVATTWLVRREERRNEPRHLPGAPKVKPERVPKVKVERAPKVKVERAPKVKVERAPKVKVSRTSKIPRELPGEKPSSLGREMEPDPRRPSLVLNLDAFTEIKSR